MDRGLTGLRWLVLMLMVLLSACAKRAESYPEEYYGEEADYGGAYDDAPMAEMSRSRAAPAPAAPMMAKSTADFAEQAPPSEPTSPSSSSGGDPGPARMVHYNGYAQLKVTRPEELVQQVVDLTLATGGYVERRSLSSVTVRVPVAKFEETFAATLALGDLVFKSVTAEDVTEAYQDVELRLRTSRETRARLQELLAKATDETEKIELLREIQRLTEEIDRIEAQLRTLGSLAAYSRITVEGVARHLNTDRADRVEVAGFGFIQSLSPYTHDLVWLGKHLPLAVPEGMVLLDTKRRFIAESADGASFRAVRLVNDPEGDSSFWIDAVKVRLAPEFATAEISALGEFQVVRFVQAGSDEPYTYVVGVRADGKHLDVIEIYYPSAAHEQRYADAVRAALTEEGS